MMNGAINGHKMAPPPHKTWHLSGNNHLMHSSSTSSTGSSNSSTKNQHLNSLKKYPSSNNGSSNNNKSMDPGAAALFESIRNKHFRQAVLLVQSGCSVNCRNEKTGETPLIALSTSLQGDDCGELRQKFAKFFIDSGANCNAADHQGRTVLMYASLNGQVSFVEFLFYYGHADYKPRDRDGNTAIMMACQTGNKRLLQVFIDYFSAMKIYDIQYLRQRNLDGQSALEILKDKKYSECCHLLTEFVTMSSTLMSDSQQFAGGNFLDGFTQSNGTLSDAQLNGSSPTKPKFLQTQGASENQNGASSQSSSTPKNMDLNPSDSKPDTYYKHHRSFSHDDHHGQTGSGLITISPANNDPTRKVLQQQLMKETLNWFNSSQQQNEAESGSDYESSGSNHMNHNDHPFKSTPNVNAGSSDGSVTLKLPPISSNSRLIDYNTWVERNFGPKAKAKGKPGPFTS